MNEKCKKTSNRTLDILEHLPPKIDLQILQDQFSHYKHPRKKIFDEVRKGNLELICRGNYLNLKSQKFKKMPLEWFANSIYFPSYISAEWALQHYNLLTERVYTITSVTMRKSVSFETSLGRFEYTHLHKHRHSFGFKIDDEFGYLIARPEKALLDYLKIRNHVLHWKNCAEMETYFRNHLRIDFDSLLDQIEIENLKEILQYFHRNAVEVKIIKWLAKLKEQKDDSSN